MLDRRFETAELGPGLRAHVLPTAKFKTTTVKAYLATSLGADATAFALVPYVLKRGTETLPTLRDVTRKLEDLYGASCIVDILKLGERQAWTVRLEVVADAYLPGVRLFAETLAFLRDLLRRPRMHDGAFLADFVAQEKRNLKKFIEGLVNDKASYAVERCSELMCEGEPFGRYEYGRVEDLEAIEPGGLAAYWRDRIDRSPIDLYVLGDVDVAATLGALREAFAGARRGDERPLLATPHPEAREVRRVAETMPVEQAKLVLGYRSAIDYRDRRFAALLLMNGVLGAFPHSKLFRHVREEASLCYSVFSSLERTKGLLFVSAGIDADKEGEALSRIEEQLEKVRRGEVDDDEISMARLSIANAYRQVVDGAARTIGWHYAAAQNGRAETIAEATALVDRATLDDVVEAAKGLRLDTIYTLRDGRKGDGDG